MIGETLVSTIIYPPSQKTMDLPVDEWANDFLIGVEGVVYATVRCRTQTEADNRLEAEGEDG